MAAPTIPNGEEQFFPIIYEGNGAGQRVGKFVPFTDNGTIANSCLFENNVSSYLSRTLSSNGSGTTVTFSCWVKRDILAQGLIGSVIMMHSNISSNSEILSFDSSDRLHYYEVTSGSRKWNYISNRTFEDTSKWYHILVSRDTTNATQADRVKIYVDGERITSWNTETQPALNATGYWNQTTYDAVVGNTNSGSYIDGAGYLAEVNMVDGTAMDVSTFGVTDTSTGRWIPKTLSGITYGTNGFRLEFGDSSALGDDTSGNTNDFTATNLASTDQTTDSPTQNFATLNPNPDTGGTLSEGNLKLVTANTGYGVKLATLRPKSGKYYAEFTIGSGSDAIIGVQELATAPSSSSTSFPQGDGSFGWYEANGNVYTNGTTVATSGSTYTSGDVLAIALDLDNQEVKFYKNNTLDNTIGLTGKDIAMAVGDFANADDATITANFGQKSFTYTPPTGFSALQQDNLPETAKGVSGLVWIKNRDASSNHSLQDSSRGSTQMLYPDLTSQQYTVTDGVQKFLKGGFQMEDDTLINTSGNSYVSWNWVANGGTTATNNDGSITSTVQVNTTAGFSIVRWTGGGSAGTVGHGLSQTPEWIFYKRTNATGDGWITYHKDQDASPANGSMQIQSDGTYGADSTLWNNTAPTSSVISIGTYGMQSSEERTAWVWHGIEGFSKFGKYVGNGSADGPFVYLGFRPAFVCIKRLTAGYHWTAKDIARDPINPMTRDLKWNLTAADSVDANNAVDFLSNGFKIRTGSSGGTNYNGSGATHIYMAWAEHPFVGDGTSPVTAR